MNGKADTSASVALVRAFEILESFTEQNSELTLAEISEKLQVNAGTVHRLVTTLELGGYLQKDERRSSYRLGLKSLGLAKVVLNTLPIRIEAVPYLHQLAVETGANVSLGVLDQHEVLYLDRVSSPQTADPYSHSGRRVPAYCTGMGKVLIAFSTEQVFKTVIAKGLVPLTDNTVVNEEALRAELEQIRTLGYGRDEAEYMIGTHCIAAPIFDATGSIVAAISLSNTHTFLGPQEIENHAPIVLKVCSQLSHRLGFSLYEPQAKEAYPTRRDTSA